MPLRSSTPPSLIGLVTKGISSTLPGGYSRPLLGTVRPVAVGDGGRFDRRLGAVQKTVEHLRVQAAAVGLFGREAVIAPDGLGRGIRKVRQPLVAAPGRHDREAAGACPVDQVADERRLVAEGERTDHACIGRLVGEKRAAKGVGLDRHVDDMLAFLVVQFARQRTTNPGDDQRLVSAIAVIRRPNLIGSTQSRTAGRRGSTRDRSWPSRASQRTALTGGYGTHCCRPRGQGGHWFWAVI